MRARCLLTTVIIPLLLAAAPARAQSAEETPWARVSRADLERFESNAGSARVNNMVIARDPTGEGAGPAAPFEFSASVANRGGDRLRVYLQIVGVKADGTPTLSCNTYVDVEGRRNGAVHESFRAPEAAVAGTEVFWVRLLAIP